MEYLLWLRKATMNEHLFNAGLFLTDEEHLLRIHYLFDQSRIILLQDEHIGLLKVDEKENSVEIVQVQIDPAYQGKGIGQQVIQTVIENARSNNKQISLSVLKENKAKALYLRLGFSIVGEDDDSLVMLLDK